MRYVHWLRLLSIAMLAFVFAFSGLFGSNVEAQGGVLLRQPFAGTYRLTAYVDHRSPNYTYDGNVVVYNGEERPNCPDCGETWTNQGLYCYDGHNATDYALPGNTPVLAAASGRVTFRGWRSTYYGNSIRIDHGNGYETWYSHLAAFSVNLNDIVSTGQQIGLSGNTGQNQPYHLHFEVRYNGNVTDPFGWRGNWSDPLPGGPAVCLWGDGQCFEIVVEDESCYLAGDNGPQVFTQNGPAVFTQSGPWVFTQSGPRGLVRRNSCNGAILLKRQKKAWEVRNATQENGNHGRV